MRILLAVVLIAGSVSSVVRGLMRAGDGLAFLTNGGHVGVSVLDALPASPQQRQIVRLLLEGHEVKHIAQNLNIAVPTVRTYLGRICSHLGVSDRAELVLWIFRQFRQGCVDCPRRQRRKQRS